MVHAILQSDIEIIPRENLYYKSDSSVAVPIKLKGERKNVCY